MELKYLHSWRCKVFIVLERKHLKFLSSAEIPTFLGTRSHPATHAYFLLQTVMAGKGFLFWQHREDAPAPFLYSGGHCRLGGNAWQGSGGDCPCAFPCSPSGRCPWVSHPRGSQPRTFTSKQFVAIVCKWWERGAAFHLAASAGDGGL